VSTSQPIQQSAIQQYAQQLYLTTVANQFSSLAEEAVRKKQSHLSYLEALLEAEVEERDRRAVIRRIKEAHFPAVKTLEEFDFQSATHIPVALIKKLSEGEYLERKEPVIFLGETGTGKSHLAVGCSTSMITPPSTRDPGRADKVNLPRVLSSHEEATFRCAKARPGSNSSLGSQAPVRSKTSGPHLSAQHTANASRFH